MVEQKNIDYCRIQSGPTNEAYMRDWGQGNKHKFSLYCSNDDHEDNNTTISRTKTIRASKR